MTKKKISKKKEAEKKPRLEKDLVVESGEVDGNSTIVLKPVEGDAPKGPTILTEEVPQEEIKALLTNSLKQGKVDYSKEIMAFVGRSKAEAEEYLQSLKTEGVISGFEIVPIGMVRTMQLRPGVVTVVIDAMKTVIDMEIS